MGNSEDDRIRLKNEKWLKEQKKLEIERRVRLEIKAIKPDVTEEQIQELVKDALREKGLT